MIMCGCFLKIVLINPTLGMVRRSRCGLATVAQLVEQLICNQSVGGSSPLGGSLFYLIKLE